MKRILFLVFLSAGADMATIAQGPIIISAEGGINNASSAVKGKGHMGNGYNVQGNVFVPFFSKNNGAFTLGILAGGGYHTHKNLSPDLERLRSEYKLYNGNLDIADGRNRDKASNGFMGSLGVQADFSLGAFVLSPSINAGYFSLKQRGFSQTAVIPISDGAAQTVALYELPESTRTGFLTMPKLRISYSIAQSFRVYTSLGANIGSAMDIEQSVLEPQGGFNDRKTYEPKQLSSGKMTGAPLVSVGYQTLVINAGLSWSLGNQTKGQKAKQTQGATFGEKAMPGNNPLYQGRDKSGDNPLYEQPSSRAMPGTPIGGVIVKGGKNPGGNKMTAISDNNGEFEFNAPEAGNYKFTLTAPEEPQGKSINEKGVKRAEAQDFNTTRSNKDNRLAAEPGVDGDQTNNNHQLKAQNNNTVRSNRGDNVYRVDEEGATNNGHQLKAQNNNTVRSNRGDNVYRVDEEGATNNGHQLKAQNNNTVRSNRSNNAYKITEASDPFYDQTAASENTTVKQSQGNSFGESMASGMQSARPGGPLKGIDVKLGKNPNGGIVMKAISNENGEVEFNNLEAGNYKVTLVMPNEPQGKSINEKGVKRAAAQDFNSSRSNKDNRLAVDPGAESDANNAHRLEAQDFNTTRSNRERGQLAAEPGVDGDRANNSNQLKAQNNNTIRSNRGDNAYRVNEESDPNNSNQLKAQNNNTVRSNRGDNAYRVNEESDPNNSNQLKAQNNNTVRSNRSNNAYRANEESDPNNSNQLKAQNNNTVRSNRSDNAYKITEASDPLDEQTAALENTTMKQTQGRNFGEKAMPVNNPLYEDDGGSGDNPMFEPSSLARPGTPIGGVIVKGGKNPGGNTMTVISDNNGEVEFNNLEAGDYKITLVMPNEPQGKSINEKGVKRAEAQDFNTTRSNKDNRLAAEPAVDGEQTNNAYQLKAQNNNTVRSNRSNNAYKITEASDPFYDPTAASENTIPGNNPLYQGRDKSGDNPLYEQPSSRAMPGTPIGGVIVKGGKNPGGNMLVLTPGRDGIIQFEVLEAGNYKFIIQTPE